MTHTQQKILDAATRCFSRTGFADTTIETIAQEAGVNKVTIFRNFTSKDNLFSQVIQEFTVKKYLAPQLPASYSPDGSSESLRTICTALFHELFRNIHILRIQIQADGFLEANHLCLATEVYDYLTAYCQNAYPLVCKQHQDLFVDLLGSYIVWFVLEYNKDHDVWESSPELEHLFLEQLEPIIQLLQFTLNSPQNL